MVITAAVATLLALTGCRGNPPRAENARQLSAPVLTPTATRDALLRDGIEVLHMAQCEADLAQHQRADSIAAELIARDQSDARALTLRAAARAGLHQFEDAAALAERAIAINPYDAAAYAVLADALIELGQYDRALHTVQHLLNLKPTHAAYARAAYLRVLYGDQAGGLRLMRLAVSAAPPNRPDERAWHLVQLAHDALAAGDIATAEHAYQQVLSARPEDGRALQGRAAIAAGRGELESAIELYERATAGGPAPDAHAALADIYTALDRRADAQRHYRAAERAELAERERMERPEGRHLALLYADYGDPAEALRLAEQDAAHRDDVFTADAVAWALYRAGRIPEARRTAARALRLGTRDPLLLYHAGSIAAADGDHGEAERLLSGALVSEAALGPLRAAHARALLSASRAATGAHENAPAGNRENRG
ncbi:MAG: tetratricopeptide repeat protein [Candidatus Binatia bacterium]